MTATPAVISGSRRAVRLVLGATAAVVAALVLLGLLVAVLVARASGGTALGLGLGAAGAALLGAGLLVVARAGALARQTAGPARATTLLTRCVLAATVAAVAMAVAGVVAVSGSRAPAPGIGAGTAAVLLVGLAALAGRSRRGLHAAIPAAREAPTAAAATPVPVIPAQRTAEPAPVPRGASDSGPAADAR